MKFSEGWKLGIAVVILALVVVGFLGLSWTASRKGALEVGASAARFMQAPLQNLEALSSRDRRAELGGPDIQYIRPGGEPWRPPAALDVEQESQDIAVQIDVEHQRRDGPPRYKMKFDGRYVLRNKGNRTTRSTWLFPFPKDTEAKWNTQILVDNKPVTDAEFTTDGVTWSMDIEAGGKRDLHLSYEAWGKQAYVYELSKAGRMAHLKVAVEVRGMRGEPEMVAGTLDPTSQERQPDRTWAYMWQYDGLVADRDIGLRFHDGRSQGDGAALLVRAPWIPLAMTLGFALWIGAMSHLRGVRLRPVHTVLMAACFFLFAPAMYVGSELWPTDWAYAIATIVVGVMICGYSWANVGPAFTGQFVLTALVLFLGSLGVIALAPWLTKVCVTTALLVIVGTLMLATKGAPEEPEPEPRFAEAAPPPVAPAHPTAYSVQPTPPPAAPAPNAEA